MGTPPKEGNKNIVEQQNAKIKTHSVQFPSLRGVPERRGV